ncbi:MAG: hypothetical protein ABJH82_09315 [Polaribacter sp.]|uniref:hypothetical protein n=1 Tax=Polaribacter sp. TaxID=1920175 RepID=UPI0032646410
MRKPLILQEFILQVYLWAVFGTWDFIARKPELFAAAIPMAGYSDPHQIQKIKEIPIWIFHGNKDQWNPVQGSRTIYQLLKKHLKNLNLFLGCFLNQKNKTINV